MVAILACSGGRAHIGTDGVLCVTDITGCVTLTVSIGPSVCFPRVWVPNPAPFAGPQREASPWNMKHLHREIRKDQKYKNKQMRNRRLK